MRVLIDVRRGPDGRLEGVVHLPDGHRDRFDGLLELLRVLEGIDLARGTPRDREDGDG
jgi:hypothetical protein